MNASGFGVTANAFYHAINSSKFNQSTIYAVIKGYCEYEHLSIDITQVKPEARKLAKNPTKFKEIYGSKIPIMARRYSSIYIIIKMSSNTSEIVKEVTKGGKIGFNGAIISASVEAKVKEYMKSSSNHKDIEVSVLTRGGGGLENLILY
ncbi:MAG: hypothetical protein IPP32_12885 [Bacteroidetes bacterium]|nr:hypothetical protein [Bacteroidota bacterium]